VSQLRSRALLPDLIRLWVMRRNGSRELWRTMSLQCGEGEGPQGDPVTPGYVRWRQIWDLWTLVFLLRGEKLLGRRTGAASWTRPRSGRVRHKKKKKLVVNKASIGTTDMTRCNLQTVWLATFLQNCIILPQSVAELLLSVQKSKMAADAILDFIFVQYYGISDRRTIKWIHVLNFVRIYAIANELWTISGIQNGGHRHL